MARIQDYSGAWRKLEVDMFGYGVWFTYPILLSMVQLLYSLINPMIRRWTTPS